MPNSNNVTKMCQLPAKNFYSEVSLKLQVLHVFLKFRMPVSTTSDASEKKQCKNAAVLCRLLWSVTCENVRNGSIQSILSRPAIQHHVSWMSQSKNVSSVHCFHPAVQLSIW